MSFPVTQTHPPQRTDPARLLVVRLGAMGDVLHTLPAVELLCEAWPETRVTWVVEPRWAPLLTGHPEFDVVPVPVKSWTRRWFASQSWREANRSIRGLRERRFDLAVVFHSLIKATMLARLAGPRETVGFDTANLREPLSRLLLDRQITANREHVVDKNLALVRELTGLRKERPNQVRLPAGDLSADLPQGEFVLTSPMAGWRSKEWPAEYFARLASLAWQQRGVPLVLDGAPNDRGTLQRIADQAPSGACVVHVSTVDELIGATRRASAVLGVDSGPLHLADLMGKPGVALFGPTEPKRNGPRNPKMRTLRRGDAATSYGREGRIADSMRALTPDDVWRELAEVIPPKPTLTLIGSPKETQAP